jgi:hypothetical protein
MLIKMFDRQEEIEKGRQNHQKINPIGYIPYKINPYYDTEYRKQE